jgi:hypothetical protein
MKNTALMRKKLGNYVNDKYQNQNLQNVGDTQVMYTKQESNLINLHKRDPNTHVAG